VSVTSFSVSTPTTLVAFLRESLPDMKGGTLKDRLRDGGILVNGVPQRRATATLAPGDTVSLSRDKAPRRSTDAVTPLHVDGDIVVVDKPAGLLTVGTDKGTAPTALQAVRTLLKARRDGHGDAVFPCHRLDRGTSGVLLLARSAAVQEEVFARWSETEKTYTALVEGRVLDDAGTIDRALFENPATLSVRVSTQPNAKPAVTHYRVLQRGAAMTLLEVAIDTGRKHQIRVHMHSLGHPIVGDDRYGSTRRKGRLFLHATRLAFPHPTTGERLVFEVAAPRVFFELVRG
jgi:23S rRNA pseudouridine1911/1915/1917 synthase